MSTMKSAAMLSYNQSIEMHPSNLDPGGLFDLK